MSRSLTVAEHVYENIEWCLSTREHKGHRVHGNCACVSSEQCGHGCEAGVGNVTIVKDA